MIKAKVWDYNEAISGITPEIALWIVGGFAALMVILMPLKMRRK